eukprot:CAMPEP_0178969304 /NCGR_PEP_ID=MMETSP0789-20121207/18774_1 /TAXON_ID=3005 /ORGANISM="Rhizosolenia setigera, Strain CCMP 1694" /LENGTH=494 /DNA_ID=CAMNT_0020655407 /DNA_START=217 /DNA_END=1701 /DNA_ORIENTATION=-
MTNDGVQSDLKQIVVIGGGASGMFSAANVARELQQKQAKVRVVVLEGTKHTMSKVKISGGGRCNVLHDTTKPISQLLSSYPRGSKELNGLFNKHYTPSDARKWFESQNVQLKTEEDGRMFPVTDSSQTIIDAIENVAIKAGVIVKKQCKVTHIQCQMKENEEINDLNKSKHRFLISYRTNNDESASKIEADAIILATGSSKSGYELAEQLGHTIVQPVPSLFTLSSKEYTKPGNLFDGLSGVSVPYAETCLKVKVPGKKKKKQIVQNGPLLITHHGISGPAALKLSAFAAREFHNLQYHTSDLYINWLPILSEGASFSDDILIGGRKIDFPIRNVQELNDQLWTLTNNIPKKVIASNCPIRRSVSTGEERKTVGLIPKRLWKKIVLHSGFDENVSYAEAPKKKIMTLSRNLMEFQYEMSSKGVFKEEFVTAGGISLKEILFKNMSSKKCEGLFLCGELLDVDGITGGFNFNACWATGRISAKGVCEFIEQEVKA